MMDRTNRNSMTSFKNSGRLIAGLEDAHLQPEEA